VSEDADLTAADYIIESIEIEDSEDLNEIFSALAPKEGQEPPDIEIDEEPLRPAPSFGPLAEPDAKRAEGSVFDPDRFQGEGEGPVSVEQIELHDSEGPGTREAKKPGEAKPAGEKASFPDLESKGPELPHFEEATGAEAPPPRLSGEEERPSIRELWAKRQAQAPTLGDAEEEDAGGLFKSWLRSRLELLRGGDEEEPEAGPRASGVDASPPRRGLLARLGLGGPTEREEEEIARRDRSGFAELLRPLSGSEVRRLQAELAAEEPIFVQLERARDAAVRRQTLAFYVGLALLVAFFAVFQTSYLTTVLPQVEAPQAISTPPVQGIDPESWREGIGALLFALGLLLPFLALFAAVEGVWRLLQLADGIRGSDIFLGSAGLISAIVVLLSLAGARVIFAAAWMLGFWVVRSLYVGWEERRRDYG